MDSAPISRLELHRNAKLEIRESSFIELLDVERFEGVRQKCAPLIFWAGESVRESGKHRSHVGRRELSFPLRARA
jgi:hypothetical protein